MYILATPGHKIFQDSDTYMYKHIQYIETSSVLGLSPAWINVLQPYQIFGSRHGSQTFFNVVRDMV